jgi:hypothetical protein
MNRLNRYARDGSILSLLPNPLTRVDLSPLASRLHTPKSAPSSGSAGVNPSAAQSSIRKT